MRIIAIRARPSRICQGPSGDDCLKRGWGKNCFPKTFPNSRFPQHCCHQTPIVSKQIPQKQRQDADVIMGDASKAVVRIPRRVKSIPVEPLGRNGWNDTIDCLVPMLRRDGLTSVDFVLRLFDADRRFCEVTLRKKLFDHGRVLPLAPSGGPIRPSTMELMQAVVYI